MPAPPVTELSEPRARHFSPGGRRLSRHRHAGRLTDDCRSGAALNLSPASIRYVMQELEELGLLAAPHTSAGRMPTETGPPPVRRRHDAGRRADAGGARGDRARCRSGRADRGGAGQRPARCCPACRRCAGLVHGAAPRAAAGADELRAALADQALAVLVGEDGSVENRVVDLPAGGRSSALVEAGNFINARLAGRTLGRGAGADAARDRRRPRAARQGGADLVERGLAIWSEDGARRPVLIVRGQANLLDEAAPPTSNGSASCSTISRASSRSPQLLDCARAGDATRSSSAAENRLFALSGSSVIAAPTAGARDGWSAWSA